MSLHCYLVGALGGICGECENDADCEFGCSAPNPLADPPQGSACNEGNLGEGCETDDVCGGPLVCAEIFNIPGVLEASSCSECAADTDCNMGLCSPQYDVAEATGVKVCVAAGTVLDGSGCDLDGSGDQACAGGHCAAATIGGLFSLGVCSECEINADCGSGVCVPPQVDLGAGLIAGQCA